jgi:hypothetical protein
MNYAGEKLFEKKFLPRTPFSKTFNQRQCLNFKQNQTGGANPSRVFALLGNYGCSNVSSASKRRDCHAA